MEFNIDFCNGSWKRVSGTRELQQSNFIDVVKSAGGVGGFVTCAEDAMEILNG